MLIKFTSHVQGTPFQWSSSHNAGFMPADAVTKPWLPIHPNYKDVNVALHKTFNRSTLKFYKRLVELRQTDTFVHGTFESWVLNENVFAYVRYLKVNLLRALLNLID